PDVVLPQGSERLRLLEDATVPVAVAPATVAAPTPAPDATTSAAAAAGAGAGEAEATTSPLPSPPKAAACFAFGPYADIAARDRAHAALAPAVRRLALREVRTAPRGWDVRLVGLADRETANATATRLAAAGFKDHYILPAAGTGTMDIALGRFGSEASAQRHQAALRGAGFDAVAGPIGETGAARHWIDVEAAAGFDVAGLRRASGAAQAERIGCEALAKAP
ncbi:MAG: SPOR domain-containing protein, partial [Luteimonas sp.]|nr:SPOR domain-containing protein [Luteimonas sp.]